MARKKKAPVYQYGIEITKPHSTEMYDHNDLVADEMKFNLKRAWKTAAQDAENDFINDLEEDQQGMEFLEADSSCANKVMLQLSSGVTITTYGGGFTVGDVQEDFESDLENMPNWQLHQEYPYLVTLGAVPRTAFKMLGFEDDVEYHEPCHDKMVSPAKKLNTPKTAKLFVD